MLVAIALFPRITALDAIGPYEVLQRVPSIDVVFVGERRGEVRTDNGMLGLMCDASFDEVTDPDVLLVPGGVGTRTCKPAPAAVRSVAAAAAAADAAVGDGAVAGLNVRGSSKPSRPARGPDAAAAVGTCADDPALALMRDTITSFTSEEMAACGADPLVKHTTLVRAAASFFLLKESFFFFFFFFLFFCFCVHGAARRATGRRDGRHVQRRFAFLVPPPRRPRRAAANTVRTAFQQHSLSLVFFIGRV